MEEERDQPGIVLPDHLKDKVRADYLSLGVLLIDGQVQIEMEEIDEDGNPVPVVQHDEL